MAEKRTIELEIQDNSKTLKQQYRDAVKELQNVAAAYGETSAEAVKAAKKAADLKDQIGFTNDLVGAFNPDAKFNALSRSLGGVLDGFQAVQGGLGLIGIEGEAVEEAMVRVQSAMAFSQGIQGLMEARDSFKQLGAVAANALKGIRTGLAATGIGLFVVALGTIVAYWDDIKAAVSGVSEEQENLNIQAEKNVTLENEKLTALDSQDNILKLQGLTEKQILQLKIKQIDLVIAATEEQIKQNQITAKAQEEATLRNFEIAKQVIGAITKIALIPVTAMIAQVDLLIKGANYVSEALGGGKLIDLEPLKEANKFFDSMAEKGAKLLFDPEQVKADGIKLQEETQKQLTDLKNKRAGYVIAVQQINKQGIEDAKKNQEDALSEEERKQKEHQEKYLNEDRLRTKSVLDASNQRMLQEQSETEFQRQQNEIRVQSNQEYLDKIAAQEAAATALKKRNRDFAVEIAISGFNTIASLTELFGKKSEKAARNAFRINKAAQIASATMSTYQSAQQAYASQFVPFPDPSSPIRGAVAAGAAVFAGLANIAKIASQKFEGGGSSGGGGGVSAASAAAAGGAQMAAPQFQTIGTSGINQLATLQQQPTQAYVVSGHVTSAQALDRNRVQNATL